MASFEIVELDKDGKPRPFPAGVFPDGKTAASIMADLKIRYPDKKFQPRPIKDETNDWKAREKRRFDEGVYEPLGLDIPVIEGHFAHRAIKQKENVAFTRSESDGRADKQASVHIRAYLTEFYPRLGVEEKRKLIWTYCGEDPSNGLLFAKTADEIQHVYTNGPSSCMSYDADYWGTSQHPTRAYAGPDLEIAYIKDDNGHITARSVCWPDKKIYGAIYGDYTKLEVALQEIGYTRYDSDDDSQSFHGARMSLIEESFLDEDEGDHYEGYLCPYVDVADYTVVEGDYLVLISYKHYEEYRGKRMDCSRTIGVCSR